eukprot:scaffold21.g2096.t1
MSLRYVLLLQRDVARAAKFYSEGVGLQLKVLTERWAELQSGPSTIALKAADGEAYCTTGYSPVLSFDVEDLQDTLMRCLSLGAQMDGAIQHSPRGTVAALRGPDGHMISLIEHPVEG